MATKISVKTQKDAASKTESARRRTLRQEAKQELVQADTLLTQLTTGWEGLSNPQKNEAQRLALIVCLRCVRFLMLRAAK